MSSRLMNSRLMSTQLSVRSHGRTVLCFGVLACALAWAPSARAFDPGVEVDPIHPVASPQGYVSVEGAAVVPHMHLFFNAAGSFASRPMPTLRVPLWEGGADVGNLVQERVSVVPWLAFGLWDVVQLGVGLPVTVAQAVDPFADPRVYIAVPAAPGGGLGDFFVGAKVRLFDISGIALAVALNLDLPTGEPLALRGELGAVLTPRLVLEYHDADFRAALGLSVRARSQTAYLPDSRPLNSQGIAYVAAGARVVGPLWLMAEARGRLAFDPYEFWYGSSIDLGGGALFDVGQGVELAISGAFGIPEAYGSAQGRLGLEFRWALGLVPSDTDSDGVPDDRDRCEAEAESPNGLHDEDGCPEPDGDDDGVPDELDRCRDAAEDRAEPADDGCPADRADRDEDGVLDAVDDCPLESAQTPTGCPRRDADQDGIEDSADQCPETAEVIDGIADEDGCPDPEIAPTPDQAPSGPVPSEEPIDPAAVDMSFE